MLISKLALLFSLTPNNSYSSVYLKDQVVFRITDSIYNLSDLELQLRNLKALRCIFPESIVLSYFKDQFISDMTQLIEKWPRDKVNSEYLKNQREKFEPIIIFFKLLKFTKDQNLRISNDLEKVIKESLQVNHCQQAILTIDHGLKDNFQDLLRLELYFKNRYGDMTKNKTKRQSLRASINLFMESLDKQFAHEIFW